jgi:hypothetical protein
MPGTDSFLTTTTSRTGVPSAAIKFLNAVASLSVRSSPLWACMTNPWSRIAMFLYLYSDL